MRKRKVQIDWMGGQLLGWCGALLIVAVMLMVGCKKPQPGPPGYVLTPIDLHEHGPLPSYSEIVSRYNANIENMERLWTRAEVTVIYRDDKGKRKRDRADDSNLLVIPPDDVALSLGVGLGPQVLWVGSNSEQYWAFDLHSDDKPAYVGRMENLGKLTTRPLPAPIYPQQLPAMLGLVKLDPSVESGNAVVEWFQGYLLIEPPGTDLRMVLDPVSALPVRIDVIDSYGWSRIAVRLHEFAPVESAELPVHAQPLVATYVEAWMLDRDLKVEIRLKGMTDAKKDRRKSRAFGAVFDFENLVEIHQPKVIIDLDEPE